MTIEYQSSQGALHRRRALVAVLFSIVVHGTLLAHASGVLIAGPGPSTPVRVTLRFHGGAENRPVAAAASVSEITSPPAIAPAPRPARREVAVPAAAPKPKIASRRSAPRARAEVAAAPQAPAAQGTSTSTETSGAAGSGNDHSGSGAPQGIAAHGRDPRPYCIHCPAPRYPALARARGWEGTVDLELLIVEDGTVRDARVRRSSGHDALDRVAIEVLQQSRFSPPAKSGLPSPLAGQITYRFALARLR